MKRLLAVGAALCLLPILAAPASAGSWKFGITNKTKYVITGFRTKEKGEGWSSNWLGESIQPGEEFEMDFGTDEGECTVRTQVIFSDGSYFDYNVDYCKASHLNVYNDEIKWK